MKKIAILILSIYTVLFSNDIHKILYSIKNDIKEYNKLASKTKSNEHYQPYIVSIINNKTLQKLGCTTLLDALKLIPNVDVSSDNLNYKSLIFRGSNPSSFGQSKLFIDGILVNNIFLDGYSEYLDMPVELIKRVEVIRGPGNKTENISTYSGSIHIITYAEDMKDSSYFFKLGNFNYKVAGFKKSFTESKLKIFTDFYYKKHKYRVHVNSDSLASGLYNFPHPINNKPLSSPSDVPLDLKNYSLGVTLKYENIYIKSRLFSYRQGSVFGLNYVPSKEENYLKLPNHYIMIGYKKAFSDSSYDTRVGYNYNAMDTKSKLLPDGIKLPKASNPAAIVTFPNGVYGENVTKQQNIFHSFKYQYTGVKKHSLTYSYHISRAKTIDVVSKITNKDTGIGMVDYSETSPFFDKSAHRNSFIMSLEDKFNYSCNLQFLYSLMYENNTHIKPHIEPKMSMVYIKDDQNIYKLLYSKSYRTPSWQELYTINNHSRVGNKNLKAEEIETYEASHIKHFSNESFFQTTLFFTKNKNQITNLTPDNRYINSNKKNQMYGFELEYKGHIGPKDELYFNLSYTDGENSTSSNLALASKCLAKGYYIYNLNENFSISSLIEYISSKERMENDNREKIDSKTIVDTAINYKNFDKKYNINFSIKNIFDTKVVYPSKVSTYYEDYPSVGRKYIINFSKEM